LIAKGGADTMAEGNLTNDDKQSLLALKALIESKLSAVGDEPVAQNGSTTPAENRSNHEDTEMVI
jgi:hypothetical protein